MSESYFEGQCKPTSCIANCFDCNMKLINYVAYCSECECDIATTEAGFVNCTICGDKLENHRQVVYDLQDPKYTTYSC